MPKQFLIVKCLFLIFIISCKQNNFNHNNSQANIDSVYSNAASFYFAQDSLDAAIDTINGIYFSKKNPTIWDKKNYYVTNALVIGRQKGDFRKAISYLDSFLFFVENGNENYLTPQDYSNVYIEKAYAYFEMANYELAIENYFKAEKIIENHVNDCELGSLTHSIAIVLFKQKQFAQSLDYFKKEYDLIRECKPSTQDFDPGVEQQVLNNIGLSFYKLKQFDSAQKYFNNAIAYINENHYLFRKKKQDNENVYNTCMGVVLGNLAKIYVEQKSYDSAIQLLNHAIFLNTKKGFERNDAQICRVQLAEIYNTINDLPKMFAILNDYSKEFNRSKYLSPDVDWYRLMAAYYHKINDIKNEIYYYKNFVQKRDSINALQNLNQTASITRELENKQQKLKIDILQRDNQLSKLYILIIASGFFLIAIISFLIFRSYRKEKNSLELLTVLNNEIINQQEVLRKTLEQLKILNLEKDKILNVVAHDLRNPIGAIANFLEIIQAKYEHSEAENKIIQNSQHAAVRSLHLIGDLLEVNKINSEDLVLVKQKTDLIKLIEESIEQVQYKTISKQQKIIFNKNTDTLIIPVDEEKLIRVIINLLDNAIKFSYINSTISINLIVQEESALIQIKDNGMGIPTEMQEHLFTSSITIKRKGTHNETSNGLGLAICKQIIEKHQGKIWVNSNENIGSTFIIEIPFTKQLTNNI
jgi:two-component system, OmpR family, sensor histidine kinase VicK